MEGPAISLAKVISHGSGHKNRYELYCELKKPGDLREVKNELHAKHGVIHFSTKREERAKQRKGHSRTGI